MGEERVPCFLLATNPQKTFKEVERSGFSECGREEPRYEPSPKPIKDKDHLFSVKINKNEVEKEGLHSTAACLFSFALPFHFLRLSFIPGILSHFVSLRYRGGHSLPFLRLRISALKTEKMAFLSFSFSLSLSFPFLAALFPFLYLANRF